MRAIWVKMSSDLLDSRLPLISTLPLACPNPRSCSLSRIEKPGIWRSMSSAFLGAKRAKSATV